MSWNNILKTDACVSETKEIFHDFLQKLGANNELLEGLKNANGLSYFRCNHVSLYNVFVYIFLTFYS